MGVTLHAIIECFYPGEPPHTRDCWMEQGTWDFGKDYALMRSLDRVCARGWPLDSSFARLAEYDWDVKQWCDADTLKRVLDEGMECDFDSQLRALDAALQMLISSHPVRVLFGRL